MRKSIHMMSVMALTAMLGVASATADTPAGLSIDNYALIGKERVTRTVYRYTFTADAVNQAGRDFNALTARLTSSSPHTAVVDGTLAFGNVPAGQTVMSADTFVIDQERGVEFDPNALSWDFQWDFRIWDAPAPAGYTACPPGWGLTYTSLWRARPSTWRSPRRMRIPSTP